MFERLLLGVRNIGNYEELSISYLENLRENTAFRDGMEHAVLSALREWTESTRTDTPPPPTPQNLNEQRNNKGLPAYNLNDDTDEQERAPYYWENF